MSAARNVSAWKVLSGTPNCLRVLRYSEVASSANCMAPTASMPAAMRAPSRAEAIASVASAPASPRGTAGVDAKAMRAARPPSWVA